MVKSHTDQLHFTLDSKGQDKDLNLGQELRMGQVMAGRLQLRVWVQCPIPAHGMPQDLMSPKFQDFVLPSRSNC